MITNPLLNNKKKQKKNSATEVNFNPLTKEYKIKDEARNMYEIGGQKHHKMYGILEQRTNV